MLCMIDCRPCLPTGRFGAMLKLSLRSAEMGRVESY